MMELGLCAQTIEFSYINSDVTYHGSRQGKLPFPTNISKEIAETAFRLFKQSYSHWPSPLRKIGVRGCDLVNQDAPVQLTFDMGIHDLERAEDLEQTVNMLRKRYGNKIIQRSLMLTDPHLSGLDAKKDHTTHPVGVFNGGVSAQWGSYTTQIIA
jgi:DNA polymerase-4